MGQEKQSAGLSLLLTSLTSACPLSPQKQTTIE